MIIIGALLIGLIFTWVIELGSTIVCVETHAPARGSKFIREAHEVLMEMEWK